MSLLTAILFGIVFGITEFLPLSSSGHFSVMQAFFKLNYSDHAFFEVLLNISALAVVILVFGKDIKSMMSETVGYFVKDDEIGMAARDGRLSPNVRLTLFAAVGTVPFIISAAFMSKVEKISSNTIFLAFALIISAAIIFVTGLIEPGKKTGRSMTALDSLIVGLAQAAAVIPGLSRTGTTVAAGISRGLKKDFAIKFSFLLAFPYYIVKTVLKLIGALSAGIDWSSILAYLLGAVFSAVCGYFALLALRYLIENMKLKYLAYYTAGIGVLTLLLTFIL